MSDALWAGRFSDGPHPEMIRLTRSIEIDLRLLPYDVAATKAHARSLVEADLLSAEDLVSVDRAADQLVVEWERGDLQPSPLDEDVHSLVERELTERLGDTGARIHAGRSRNDLVAQDLRLWCSDAAARLADLTRDLIGVLTDRAQEHRDDVMPGYTHLQRAQPVSVGFYLCAHGAALARDAERFDAARAASEVCVLGAGALAGTTLALDPAVVADQLGLEHLFVNAMDAVSDRDFVCDLVYACALCGVHLSRLAEEIVIFSSSEFAFLHLPDAWSTGSSMMPQKRNPDLAELIRGRAAGGIGDITALLSLLKGLPLAYDRDLQEDKGHLFAAVDRMESCLVAMSHLMEVIEFRTEVLERAAGEGATWATDVAERYVTAGMPFRQAHGAAGRLVAAVDSGAVDLTTEVPETAEGPRRSMRLRNSHGGTAPERVDEQIRVLREACRA
ncbi:MAG: argininosuccinate lyase [Actinomycetota bacterium]|nr:argininosuccinate lyase [Actinomycetota bacterium]